MTTITGNKNESVATRKARIGQLNLESIMVKLMEEEGWTLDQSVAVEPWYKKYLMLNLVYPGKHIVPSKQVDTFWHYHILDTMKYQEDCQHAFGYFLHHFPYFGLRGTEDAEQLVSSFEDTLALYQKEFHASPEEISHLFHEEAARPSGCDTGPGSCHVSCYSACHAAPVARSNKKMDISRPAIGRHN